MLKKNDYHTKSSTPYYEGLGEEYDKYYVKHYAHAFKTIPKLVSSISRRKNQLILDVGAGTGAATLPLAKQGHTIYSVDNCEKMIKILQEKIKSINLEKKAFPIHADILDSKLINFLPQERILFDGIVFWGNGLCHICPRDYELMVINFQKLLKPKGWLLLDYRSGDAMRSRGTHIEILYETATEIRLSCVHSVPQKGFGPIHRALITFKVSSCDTDKEPRMTTTAVNSIWPYLVDDTKLNNALEKHGFSKASQIKTDAPLTDMVTDIYWQT